MNIAHILPRGAKFPLEVHNGRYSWVFQLAILQKNQGHDVSIYCHPDSKADGILTRGIEDTGGRQENNINTFRLAIDADHDIYHSHFDNLHYLFAHLTKAPIVFTQHWWPYEETIKLARNSNADNIWAVPPTKYMYDYDIKSGIKSCGYIYHGIDLTIFRPRIIPKTGRLLSVSRISSEKNIEYAIEIAKSADFGLDIIGKVSEKNIDYLNELSKLIDGDQIKYLGVKNTADLIDYYSSARALLFVSDDTEAFGLAPIESQACGTPVIMQRGGSKHELVKDGKTGFLCFDNQDYINAIHDAEFISSQDCIDFASNFDINTMATAYNELYRRLID